MDYYRSFASHLPSYKGAVDLFIRQRRTIKYLQKAIKIEPESAVLLYCLGQTYHFTKAYDKAIEVLSKAIKLYPDTPLSHYTLRGWAYSLSGNYEKAIADYTKAGEWDTSYHWCYFRGQAHFRYKHFREAVDDFSTVLQHQHYWTAQIFWRAKAYIELGEYDKAIDDYSSLLPDDGVHIIGSYNYLLRGKVYKMKGDKFNAAKDFAMAKRLEKEELENNKKQKGFVFESKVKNGLIFGGKVQIFGEQEKYKVQYKKERKMIEKSAREKSAIEGAEAYRVSHKYNKAITYYNKAISQSPNDAIGYGKRGVCFNEMGKLKEAMNDYNHALSIDNSLYYGYYQRAMLYMLFFEYDKAAADFSRSLEFNPQFIQTYKNRAKLFYIQGEFDKAIEDETQLLKIDKNRINSHNFFRFENGYHETPNKRKRITDAIEENPCYAGAYFYRGRYAEIESEYDKAIVNYSAAIRYKPDLILAYFFRALAYLEKEEYDKALADFSIIWNIDPSITLVNLELAYLSTDKHDYAKAIEYFTIAIKNDDEEYGSYEARGILYEELGQIDKALEDYNEAIKLFPWCGTRSHIHRTAIYIKTGEYKKVIDGCNFIINNVNNPPADFAMAYNTRGDVYYKKGNIEQAFVDYNTAIQIASYNDKAYFNRGLIYLEKADYEKAIQDFSEAIKCGYRNIKAYKKRAECYMNIGKTNEAEDDFKEVERLKEFLPEERHSKQLFMLPIE
jgi:tetratricopeptide (TPR) repeat protein